MNAVTPADADFGLTKALMGSYLAALVDGDRNRAAAAIDHGLDRGLDTPPLLLEVLGPAQRELGELWHRGDLTIAQEHWGTQVTAEEVERVLQQRRPLHSIARSVLVTTPPGEEHTLPARMVAGLLSWRGWTVDYLGEGPPVDDLVEYVRQRQPDLVAVSVTLPAAREGVVSICRQIGALGSAPPVLAGGSGVHGITAEELGAGALSSDALEGLETASKLVGLGSTRDLTTYLAIVGRRIQEQRRGARMSQSELAERSRLTRPYLSAVERGRQNITLDAALKIASALGVGMSELLDEAWQ